MATIMVTCDGWWGESHPVARIFTKKVRLENIGDVTLCNDCDRERQRDLAEQRDERINASSYGLGL